jgi:hypothetical protein
MMGALTRQVKRFPWHPYLLGVFPVLFLRAHNLGEIEASEALRALAVCLVAAILLTLVVNLIVKDCHRAAAISSFALVLFFSYGHVYNLLEANTLAGIAIGRHRLLAPLFLLILAAGVGWISRPQRRIEALTPALNVIALAALALPLLQIGIQVAQESRVEAPKTAKVALDVRVSRDMLTPDIYYIILDAYARDDILESFYQYDNRPFLDELGKLGFYVARCSQSNYAQTQLSLASSLNMDFIENLDEDFTPKQTRRAGMPGLIKRSTARRLLESLGYQTVAFETGYYWTHVADADTYLTPRSSTASRLDVTGGLNGFEALLIKSSAMLVAVDGASALPQFLRVDIDHPDQIHRERVLFTLDQLCRLPALPGPKFVFAHIVSPHRPFVFGPQGEVVEQAKDDINGYRDQVAYLNSRLIPILQKIIAESETPPIIIVQGDHGGLDTSVEERMAILNAYYLPGDGSRLLYENITPINTFRLIFSHYFGCSYPALEDVSYFSSYQRPFQFTAIPNQREGCP